MSEKSVKVTFPRFGSAQVSLGLFMKEIGIDAVLPAANSAKLLHRGSLAAPDDICLPFKLMLGNLMDAYDRGARLVIMPATMGPCRLGEYAELFRSVMDSEGCRMKWIVFDSHLAIGIEGLLGRAKALLDEVGCKAGFGRIRKAAVRALRLQREIDRTEEHMRRISGFCNEPMAPLLRSFRKELEAQPDIDAALRLCSVYEGRLRKMKPVKDPVRILLTGEIYSLIEPYANHFIEEKLMELGVSFRKRVTIWWWVKRTLFGESRGVGYLPYSIGGYAKETVEETANAKKDGFDGVLQLLPSGCMPELVSKSVFPRIAEESGIAISTIIFDEQDGSAGYDTRLEAFVDMLKMRREGQEAV